MSGDIRLRHLRAHSESALEEGQDYWTLGFIDLLDVLATEVAESPRARGLNPTTGEVVEGPFLILLGHMMRWVEEGSEFRIEPVAVSPKEET